MSRINSKSGKTAAEIKCVSCSDAVKLADPAKLTCQSGHSLCGECSAVFCESILAAGAAAVAPHAKCSICRGPIPSLSFERILKPDQLDTYLSYMAFHTLGANESLFHCVNCSYCEIHVDDPPIFWCKNCNVSHCVGCKSVLPEMLEQSDVEDSEDEEAYMHSQSTYLTHLKCGALQKEKAAFDAAIAAGAGMTCPGCGVIGRKDGMCTHMTCNGCETDWCYLCGLSVDDCDKAARTGAAADEPLYGHNEDWKTNPKRCPMFMSMIGEVDHEWDFTGEFDEDDEDYDEEDLEEMCLNKFHSWRTLYKLHALYNDLGEEKWKALRATFATVRNCSFTDEEIIGAGNVPLFNRPQRSRRRRRRIDFEEDDEV